MIASFVFPRPRRPRLKRPSIALLAALLLFPIFCDAARLKVVATTSIIGDWAHQVGGDDIDLTTLVGPDGDPHDFQPVPADSIKLGDANVILENGLGLETWLDKLARSSGTSAARVILTKGVKVRRASAAGEEGGEGDGQAGGRFGENDQDRDPHAWQDVRDAIIMVDNVRDAFAKADPAHAAAYKMRTADYDKKLQALDRSIASEIDSIPKDRRKLVTSHDAFGYFGRRYGIDIEGSALESITTEAADPSARELADVVDRIKSAGVSVIFLENIQNPKLIDEIAADAHVKVGPPLYSDALGEPGSAGDTYIKMMKYNAATLANALKS